MESPICLASVESRGHWWETSIMNAEVRQAKYFLDRSQQAGRCIVRGNHRPMFQVRSGDECDAAIRADMIGTVLRVVLDHKYERAVGIRTTRNLLDQNAHR